MNTIPLCSILPSLTLKLGLCFALLGQTSRRAEVRAAGAYILRVFTWPPSSAATASLLESLGACGGRPEAIRLLVKLDLFGEENESSGEGSSGLDGGRGDGTRGGGNGGGRRSPDASKEKEEAYWRRWSREDGTAVLMSLVTAVTASGSGTAAEGGGLKIRGGRTRESDGSLTEGREGNAAVARGNGGREGFSVQEQEALSSVCVEALRALVRLAVSPFVHRVLSALLVKFFLQVKSFALKYKGPLDRIQISPYAVFSCSTYE